MPQVVASSYRESAEVFAPAPPTSPVPANTIWRVVTFTAHSFVEPPCSRSLFAGQERDSASLSRGGEACRCTAGSDLPQAVAYTSDAALASLASQPPSNGRTLSKRPQ